MRSNESAVRAAYALVVEFAIGLDGQPAGLTVAELARAFLARHKVPMPKRVALEVRPLCAFGWTRCCEITGEKVLPLLPRYADGRMPAIRQRQYRGPNRPPRARASHGPLVRAVDAWGQPVAQGEG